ncbi:MAG TPA: right-handed parallel beta-helix repeat-containing protein [Candidatus Angelobacter sp.]|nr:right-handed parallel beta-helix repeat-containing protein [Candidatus Angelobacter sp.]
MRKTSIVKLLAFLMVGSSLMYAQASRTWVSGVGDDVNPCSRTAPCKTWAGAISKTAPGGEIDALDPAGFGALTITKAITLDGGGGQVASTLVSGTNGIVVQAGANDVVIIRNLRINGISSGFNGIRFLSGKALIVEKCDIFGFTQNGIDVATAGGSVFVTQTNSSNNTGSGIAITSTAATKVSINDSEFDQNGQFGVFGSNFATVVVSHTVANGNSTGFIASANAGSVEMDLVNCTAGNNTFNGVQAGGGGATANVRVAGVAVYGSANGFLTGAGGTLKSFGNNFNTGAGTPLAPNLPVQ